MADSDSTQAGALREQLLIDSLAYADFYVGTREQLITACLVAEGQFPGDPGRNMTMQTYRDPTRFCVMRKGKGRFRVRVDTTEEEQDRRYQAHLVRHAQERAEHDLQRDLACMPGSADDYRARITRYVSSVFRSTIEDVVKEFGKGYRYDAEALAEIEDALGEIVSVLQNGRIVYSRSARAAAVLAMRQRYARADPTFTGFMERFAGADHEDRA